MAHRCKICKHNFNTHAALYQHSVDTKHGEVTPLNKKKKFSRKIGQAGKSGPTKIIKVSWFR